MDRIDLNSKMQDISQLINTKMQYQQYQKSMTRQIRNIIASIGIVVVLAYVVFGIAVVNGVSMEPALYTDDVIIIWRLASDYQSGDIVTISGVTDKKLVKRVVGIPGDVITKDDLTGELLINGEDIAGKFQISSAQAVDEADGGVSYPITLGRDEYFCLGDNRTNSADSRYQEIGIINKKSITGKSLLIIRGSKPSS